MLTDIIICIVMLAGVYMVFDAAMHYMYPPDKK